MSNTTSQRECDKRCIREMANNNSASWFLNHPFFVNDDFEYILNTSRNSFILYSKSTVNIPIQHFGNERTDTLFLQSRPQFIDQLHSYAHYFKCLQQPCYHILFCLTDNSFRGQGYFSHCLQELKCKANANNFCILADTQECHLNEWDKRHFVVCGNSGAVDEYCWKVLWGVKTRDTCDDTLKRKCELLRPLLKKLEIDRD